ncbi:MAG: metallophosphoesterase family protein [bacterium]
MRYAFISDIHANLQAWRAVHLDIRSNKIDYVLCLGDVIGYGPSPAEVLNEVHAHVDAFVLGNHDAVVSGRMDDSSFNPHAREMIRWTASKLNRKASAFLSSFPLTLIGNGFQCVHGEFSRPASFEYVLNPEDALPSWKAVEAPLLLAGHTHEPSFFLMGPSGIPRLAVPQDFELEPGKRYFVNVGSVGCSRDGDPRASYCIYDTEARAVFWRRIPFDLDSYRSTLIRSGLDPKRCALLKLDPLAQTLPLRQRLDFTPPTAPEKAARPAVAMQDITSLRRSIRHWKFLFSSAIIMVALSIIAALWIWREQKDYRAILGAASPIIVATNFSAKTNLLPQHHNPILSGQIIPGWQIQLGDSRQQKASVIPLKKEGYCLQLESESADAGLTLSAPLVQVDPGQSWSMSGLFEKGASFAGTIIVAVTLIRQDGCGLITNQHFAVKEPLLARADGWMRTRQTFTIPAGGKTIQVQIRGKFRGNIRVRGLSLELNNHPDHERNSLRP